MSSGQGQSRRARTKKRLRKSDRALLAVVSAVLNTLVEHGSTQVGGINLRYPHAANFETNITDDMPSMPSIEQYVHRWMSHTEFANVFIIVAVIYIRRVTIARRTFVLSKWNCHHVFAASATVAVKHLNEGHHDQDFYAYLAGMQTAATLDVTESSFLHLLRQARDVSSRKIREVENSLIREALRTDERGTIRAILEEKNVEIPSE